MLRIGLCFVVALAIGALATGFGLHWSLTGSSLPTTPGTFGIQFQPSGKVAAQIRVVAPGQGKKQKQQRKAKERKRNR